MTPDTWKLIASIGGLLLTTVTGPLIWAIRAESARIRAELRSEIKEGDSSLSKEIAAVESRLNLKMVEMENRLNERIDTRLVHR